MSKVKNNLSKVKIRQNKSNKALVVCYFPCVCPVRLRVCESWIFIAHTCETEQLVVGTGGIFLNLSLSADGRCKV